MILPTISGFKLIKILSKNGFQIKRRKGSHVTMTKITNNKTIKLTVPLHKELKKGTLSRILKEAKINKI